MESSQDARSRKRSRSPYTHHKREDSRRHRSRSPQRRHRRHHNSCSHDKEKSSAAKISLPFNQHSLDKHDLEQYEALLAEYLDVQKQIDIRGLTRDEVKGRWKSFLGKWNRGELAEGYYDPGLRKRASERYQSAYRDVVPAAEHSRMPAAPARHQAQVEAEDDESDDGYGPALPKVGRVVGAAIPNAQDLKLRDEMIQEAAADARADLRYERKMDRQEQKGRLEELAPRADPGSRERKLAKKQDATSTLHAFREAKDGGDVDVGEDVLMGADNGVKAEIQRQQAKKSEREMRREEALRIRAAEREEKLRHIKAKEAGTVDMLREIARQRFG